MMISSILPLALLLLAVAAHAAARPPFTQCYSDVTYAPNSTYEANLRRIATVLPAAVSASTSSYAYRTVGFWPNRVHGWSSCRRRDDDGDGRYSSCAACVAGAFRELERACPYQKNALFTDRNCTLEIIEVRIFGTDGIYGGNVLKQTVASGLIFQVIGFGWLFFLLLQEWRGRKRGTAMLSSPLLDGDN